MADLPGYSFNYDAGVSRGGGQPSQLFGWQVCLAHIETRSFEDADNYADYAVNRDKICQSLGIGMASGRNAFELDGQLFVAVVAVQDGQRIQPIDEQHPLYGQIALIMAEQLLKGDDHGMVAVLPNGHLVPFVPPTDPANL